MLSNLPVELINIILYFEGSLRNRNGKWMNPLDVSKEIKEKISKCIKRKHRSIDTYREMVCWGVDIHTHKHLSLYIRKEIYSHYSNTEYIVGPNEYIGDYRIINYKEGVIISGKDIYPKMYIDEITTFNFIW